MHLPELRARNLFENIGPGPTFSVVSKYEHNLERKSVFLRHV